MAEREESESPLPTTPDCLQCSPTGDVADLANGRDDEHAVVALAELQVPADTQFGCFGAATITATS